MKSDQKKFRIENGYLCGPSGQWLLKDIKAVYKREGGKIDLKKYAASVGGITAGGVIMSTTVVGGGIIAFGALAYMMHRTMRVYALIDGQEVELLAEPYISGYWHEDAAKRACDELLTLVADAQRNGSNNSEAGHVASNPTLET